MDEVAVIGLGYVGLPLAVEFGKVRPVWGYDVKLDRIEELANGFDKTLECSPQELKAAQFLKFTSDSSDIKNCRIFIIAVPTPVDVSRRPDFGPLNEASKFVGKLIKKGDIVIYESTVFPGATESICVPVLELASGLKFNKDFFCGYSPERINPGDNEHRLPDIVKITSGSNNATGKVVDDLYSSIIRAGTFLVSSIAVAEAAKVIENTQRDLNIALMNELSLIFSELGLSTSEILDAANTKWNFLDFRPGLVGGHCIGVDPYYLTYRAEQIGFHPEVILAGRRLNDLMATHVVNRIVKLMLKKGINLLDAEILILGSSFKANCPDIRNSKVIELAAELKSYGSKIKIYDPLVSDQEIINNFSADPVAYPTSATYDAIVIAVAHDEFRSIGIEGIKEWSKENRVIFDVMSIFGSDEVDGQL